MKDIFREVIIQRSSCNEDQHGSDPLPDRSRTDCKSEWGKQLNFLDAEVLWYPDETSREQRKIQEEENCWRILSSNPLGSLLNLESLCIIFYRIITATISPLIWKKNNHIPLIEEAIIYYIYYLIYGIYYRMDLIHMSPCARAARGSMLLSHRELLDAPASMQTL